MRTKLASAHTEAELQDIVNTFTKAYESMGLTRVKRQASELKMAAAELCKEQRRDNLFFIQGSQKLNYEHSFTEGMMHVYRYEGIILTGLPESGLNRAGVKINCGLGIIPLGHSTYLLKITDARILEYNGIWPRDSFTSAHKLTQKLAPELTKPVKFEYNNGRVGNIYAPPNLPEDVLNIHKGILNIFQITMKKSQNFYELQEAGIEGVCLTNYIIQENKKAHRMTVTKSKDLNNCQEKVMTFTGAAYAKLCPICQQRGKNIRATASSTLVLKPTASGAILQEAKVREVHQFTPFHELDGTAIMEARQNLMLVNIKAAIILPLQVQFVGRGTLRYHFEEGILRRPVQLMKLPNVENAILETLKNLEQHNLEKVHSDTPAKFLKLIHLLRSAPEETIAAVWEIYNGHQFRRWIIFALPAVGTTGALKFLKTRIQRVEVTMGEAAQALVVAMHQITANLQSLSVVRELFSIVQVQQSSILRQIVYLGYGSMIFRYCTEQSTCPDNILKPLHDLLADAIVQTNEEDMVLGLKAIGNAGQPASIKSIVKLLPGLGRAAASLPLKIRVDAIMALRNIAKKDPEKVQAITIQLFMNQKNHPELRMSACAIFLCTKPPVNSLLVLASSLLKETSLQVASFAYSQFRSLARSSIPSLRSLSAGCNIAAKLLGPKFDRLGFRFSQVFQPDLFIHNLMAGAFAKVVLMNNAGSPIPTVVAAKLTGYTLGVSADLVEVGLRMEGIQEVMTKSRASVRGAPDMKQIQRILNKFPDGKSLPEKTPLASAYMKLFGQEIAFVEFRKDEIYKAIQSVTGVHDKHSTLRKLVNRLQKPLELRPSASLLTAELRRVVPTCLGLPMELSLHSAAVAKATLNVESNVPSSISTLSQLLNANIQLKAQINPSVAVYSRAIMGINTPFIQSGLELEAKIHSAVPIDVSARINVKERNLKIESTPSQQENRIIFFKSEVFAVSRNIENLSAEKLTPILPETKEISITNQKFKSSGYSQTNPLLYSGIEAVGAECPREAQRPAPKPSVYNTCMKMTTFGFEVCLDAKMANAAYVRHSPLYKLIGVHAAKVLIRPGKDTEIEKLVLELQTGPEASSTMIRPLEKEELLPERALSRKRTNSTNHPGSSSNSGHTSSAATWRINQELLEVMFRSGQRSEHTSRRLSTGTKPNSRLRHRQSSSSSRQSSEQRSLIEDIGDPTLIILARARRTDGKQQGYQVTGSVQSSGGNPKMHLRIVELAEGSMWKMCVDAAIPKAHTAMIMYRWGENCQRYKISSKASMGYLANHPAMKIKIDWSLIPDVMVTTARMVVPGIAFLLGFSSRLKANPSHQVTALVSLTSPRFIDTVVKLPRLTIYYQGFELPLPVHVHAIAPVVQARGFKSIAEIPKLLLTMNQRGCTAENERVVTFDSNELNYKIPNDCHYVLTKDCSPTPKFVLLMRRANNQQTKKAIKLLISVPNVVIEAYPTMDGIKLLVDNVETTLSNQEKVVQDVVTIREQDNGIIIEAPSINIAQLFFDGVRVQIVLDQMMSKTCGICGLNNGEKKMMMPNQEEAKDVEGLFQSWTCPGQSCKDDCKVRREFVELGKIIDFDGQQSKCYSVEPVQRCLAQCSPTETLSRHVDFHCLPVNHPVDATAIFSLRKKPVDMSHSVDSHSDCSCHCTAA
uniref:vitellogenin-like n=1 Tax=Pristiophorus japonicus TaxID=55135 RepID=UPI00398F8981